VKPAAAARCSRSSRCVLVLSLPVSFVPASCVHASSGFNAFSLRGAWEQQLWGEIGKSREERERMVRELEAECMRVYRRKVDEATGERAMLHQSLAAGEAEIAALTAALGADNSPQLKVGAKIRRFLPFLASTVLLKNDATVVHSSSRNL
jgi:hypothetical protein